MHCCSACFAESASPIELVGAATEYGNCDFCGATGVPLWDPKVFADHFDRVLSMYEAAAPPGDEDLPIWDQVENDWRIFTFADSGRLKSFLEAAFEGEHPLVNSGAKVVAADRSVDRPDHVTAWDAFATEITEQNRYFPSSAPNLDFLRALAEDNAMSMPAGTPLYRARICKGETPWNIDELGMPPREDSTAGRANPLGIPHLYLALEDSTCVYEARATLHDFVTIAKFEIQPLDGARTLVLDEEVNPINPFLVDVESDNLLEKLDAQRMLRKLGSELSKPVRSTDNRVDYVPSQYLSEYVKSIGIEGIQYPSSVYPGGRNLVLFDASHASAIETRTARVSSLMLEITDQ